METYSMNNIQSEIERLIKLFRPSKIRIFDTDPNNSERFRSIEDYSISHTLDGKLINNFTYEEHVDGIILQKTNKHYTRHVILEECPIQHDFRLFGNKKRRKRLLSLYFPHEVYSTDGTQRYQK